MFDLTRFHNAQNSPWSGYDAALSEIRGGRKTSHWIWYIFPQLKGQGRSDTAVYYGLDGLEEARAYIADPVLRERLHRITEAVLSQPEPNPRILMGSGIDCKKLCSCMTLFELAEPECALYAQVLEQYFQGRRDRGTLAMLGLRD